MNPLPPILRKHRFTYTLVHRAGEVCIYRQQVAEKLNYYEVFIVKVKPATKFDGKELPEREVFPSDEAFGKTAWSCRTLKDATNKFNALLTKPNKSRLEMMEDK